MHKLKNLLNPLLSNSGMKKYFQNISWLFLEKTIRMIVGFLVMAWMAKYLGPENFGTYNYAQGYVLLFSGIATLGLDTILVRELVKNPKNANEYLGTVFTLKFLGSILAVGAITLTLNIQNEDSNMKLFVYIIAFSNIFQAFNVIDGFYQSKVLSKYVVAVNTVGFLISSLVKIYLIYINAELLFFIYVLIFDKIILAIGYLYIYKNENYSIRNWKFNLKTSKMLIIDSWPLIFSGTVLMVQARIDQVMIKEFLGIKEVGYYSTALIFIEAFGFLSIILKQSITPALINAKKVSKELYEERLLNLYRISFILFIITAGSLVIISNYVILIFFGNEYLPAVALLSIYSIRLFFTYMGVARSTYILVENIFKYSLFSMTMGAILNVILNYILIPIYGTSGAIVATILSFSITVFVIDAFYSKTKRNFVLMIIAIVTFYKINLSKIR